MDVQAVLNAIAKTAARLCDANDALIFQAEGDRHRLVAHHGTLPTTRIAGQSYPTTRGTPHGRAMLDRRPVHVRDLARAVRREFRELEASQRATGIRTALATPLLIGNTTVGAIVIRRIKVYPFTAHQIALLKTFADQAALAIEKARLSQELETRNRDLTEGLERETASAEILRVISRSPADVTPVFKMILDKATTLSGSGLGVFWRYEGNSMFRAVAVHGANPRPERFPLRGHSRSACHSSVPLAPGSLPTSWISGRPSRTFAAIPIGSKTPTTKGCGPSS